jgi:bacterial/archaeal transporter family-2 protein
VKRGDMKFNGEIVSLLLAALAGALMAIQGTFNSISGKIIGLLEGTFCVLLLGTITAGILLLFWGNGSFIKMGSVPWYVWLGGPLGVAIIFGVAVSIPKLGVGVATTAIIGAQLLTAYCIDHFGLFGMTQVPFNLVKLGGILLIVTGAKVLLG